MRHGRVVAPAGGGGRFAAAAPRDPLHHVVDVVVQHFAVAGAELHGGRRLVGRDLEALHADAAGIQDESVHSGRVPGHRPERDRPAFRPAALDLDPLLVPARHDIDRIARLGHVGGVLHGLKRLLLRARVGIRRGGGRRIDHIDGRPGLPNRAGQGGPAQSQATCE